MSYCVVEAKYLVELQSQVRERMQAGWIPQGGLTTDNDGWYFQAMIYLPKPTQEQIDSIRENHK